MLTGTVNMSLADVDKLRNDLKSAELALKAKEEELVQVKADKRTVYVEKIRPLNKNEITITIPNYKINNFIKEYQEYYQRQHRSHYFSADFNEDTIMNNYLDFKTSHGLVSEKTSYINFDDVQNDLRKKIEEEINNELGILRQKVTTFQQQLAEVNETHNNTLHKIDVETTKLVQSLKDEISERIKVCDDLDAEWRKKYAELETSKKELTMIEELTEKVVKLEEELKAEKSKKWYQKF